MANLTRALAALFVLVAVGCAKPRDVQRLLTEPQRIEKTVLEGTFHFLKTVVEVKAPGPEHAMLAPGQYLESSKLVQFQIRENKVDVVSIDPLYETQSAAPQTRTLASFPAKSVDVERKKTPDGDTTHEEEETQQRRAWNQRALVHLDLLQDFACEFQAKSRTAAFPAPFEYDAANGSISFIVDRLLKDGTAVSIRYSFVRYHPNQTYRQRPYSEEDQVRFGLFPTLTFRLNKFDQFSESTRDVYMNRWDTARSLVFYFAPGFPEPLKPIVRAAHKEWAQAMKDSVGDDILEPIRENSGQQPGDLRYNLIVYDNSDHTAHGILGYAPLVTNPRSGEIIKADVVLYGRVLRRSIFQELFWEKAQHPAKDVPPGHSLPLEGPVSALRRAALSDLSANITRLTPEIIRQTLQRGKNAISAEQLEERVFSDVFTHEFGHALGLRHNFMGDTDTCMGYAFLHKVHREIGAYDRAALTFAYSPSPAVQAAQKKLGYSYCSDENVYTSKAPLCQPHTESQSLVELVERQLALYRSYYEVNNLRLERLSFGSPNDNAAYEQRIFALLLPLRLVYDNAEMILGARSGGAPHYPTLWALARTRIEADAYSREEDTIKNVKIGPELGGGSKSFTVQIDKSKVERLIAEAYSAKTASVEGLRRIIFDQSRPDDDKNDLVSDNDSERLQVRGVIKDKLLALSLIASPSRHALKARTILTPFSLAERTVPTLFASLLSNTSEVADPDGGPEPYHRIRFYDVGLRKHALKLLVDEVAPFGNNPEAMELISLQSVKRSEKARFAEWEKLASVRQEFQDIYGTLMLTKHDLSLVDLSPFEQRGNAQEEVFTPFEEDTLLMAPMHLPYGGLKTATGLFIRNNLNVAEDYFEAAKKTYDRLQYDLFEGGSFINAVLDLKDLEIKREKLNSYIKGENSFLTDMYRAFRGERPKVLESH